MIFSFLKKRKVKSRPPKLKVDIHSHLIPGIDDGSKSMEESLFLLKGLEELGYDKVITTPHIMLDSYRNTPQVIKNGLKSLRETAFAEGLKIEIEAAAEYYLDDGFYDLLKKNEILTVKGDYLLFETSYVSKPMHMEEMIFEILTAGYRPILAHPERYRYIKDPKKEFTRLKELGVLFQVNLNSFGGHYGKSAKSHADFLSRHGLIDFLGSDIHHKRHLSTLPEVLDSNAYSMVYQNNSIKNNDLF